MKIIVGLLLITFAVACGQADKEFNAVVTFNKGFRFTPTGTIYTSLPSSSVADWNTMINKPLVFAPATHDHNLLYKPIGYVPTWAEITSKPTLFSGSYNDLTEKPGEMELQDAISTLPGLLPPRMTQTQIDALTPVEGLEVYNLTIHAKQYYNGTIWKTTITAN